MADTARHDGKLVDNIVLFTHALRKAGVRVGTAQVQNALQAVSATGFTRRTDFYHALRATLICRQEHLETFHQVFTMFWRDPEFLDQLLQTMLPLMQVAAPPPPKPTAAQRRAAQALWDEAPAKSDPPVREELDMDMRFSWSENEVLRAQDFEQMTAAELVQAEQAVRQMTLPAPPVRSRRFAPRPTGTRPDLRQMLRRAVRRQGEIDRLALRAPLPRPPDLVAICDISGSMTVYARMMMHFLHALTWSPNKNWGKVHGFTFGTRLTNISRGLATRDIDAALQVLGQDAPDWQGGTRIGDALHAFNRDWSRRVLGRGAVVLLITDGLERGDIDILRAEAERLSLSCRRLIWLNPLLRWDRFEPKAEGIRTLLPLVDSFHACHSLDSLAGIVATLQDGSDKQRLLAAI